MDFSSSKRLAKELVKMRLVDKERARECLRLLDSSRRKGADLLQVLLDQHVLTPFQVESIKRLDTGILILGGNKLLYANAAGSFARVYRAERIEDGKTVGVKVLRQRWVNDPATVDLFRREAELGQKLKHPNIVPIFDIGHEGENHFFTMDFVQGGNLKDFVQIRKQIEPIETVKYAMDMARGLEYALNQGVTHRDLKMTNVLFSVDGVAKLIDFGLATDEEMIKRHGDVGIQQALEYSTLEKGTGAPRNDPRSDLFFLGTIMYEMMLGQPPYPRTRSREERKQITRYRNIRPLSDAMPACPRHVSSIVDRLLHINPDERYQSPGEVLQDLTTAYHRLTKETGSNPSVAGQSKAGAPSVSYSTILCVEKRNKEQDLLRDYFSHHGYRVLMMADAGRAAQRVQNDPPALLLLMALNSNEDSNGEYNQLIETAAGQKVPMLVVVPDMNTSLEVPENKENLIHICTQPMSLRKMRTELKSLAKEHGIALQLKSKNRS